MELNKLCRTCLSASKDMTSLYETCATSTPVCCAEMLSTFTPLICCKDDGLSTMICHNCVREVNRCHTFRLKCLESDRVLRKHVRRVTGVAATNMTVTNDMDEDSCIFEEVSIKNEFPTSSKVEQSATSLKDPLSITEMQEDMNQQLDIVKHELDIKIEKDDDINYAVNNAPVNEQEKKKDPYPCTLCKRSYRQSKNLTIHMRTHTGEKPYPCTVCDSSFKSRKLLTYHMFTHTGVKPYSCTVCDSSFTLSYNLASHMRTHTGEKPYSCSVCDCSFSLLCNLKLHMRTHTGEKPYPCTVCDRSFKSSKQLMFHMRTHTGDKPYTCTDCNKSYRLTHHLRTHMRTHTREKPYPCSVCDISFRSKRSLTIHKKTHTEQKL